MYSLQFFYYEQDIIFEVDFTGIVQIGWLGSFYGTAQILKTEVNR